MRIQFEIIAETPGCIDTKLIQQILSTKVAKSTGIKKTIKGIPCTLPMLPKTVERLYQRVNQLQPS